MAYCSGSYVVVIGREKEKSNQKNVISLLHGSTKENPAVVSFCICLFLFLLTFQKLCKRYSGFIYQIGVKKR